MGNNNVAGQQVSEDTALSAEKIIKPPNSSPALNNKDDDEKKGTRDEQVTSDQNHSSSENEGADEKNRSLIQDSTSMQDDQRDNLSNEDHKLVKDEKTEATINPAEIFVPVSATIEDIVRAKDSLVSSENIKQLEHGTGDGVGESTTVNSISLFDGNLEGSPEDKEESRCHENAPTGNLACKYSNDTLEKGHIVVSKIEDQLMAVQGVITSSIESTASTYHDADDSEIKEVVVEDEPEEYDGQLVSPLEGNGNLACLFSSYHLVPVNERKEKRLKGIQECDKDTTKEIQEQGTAEGLGQLIGAQVTQKQEGDLCNLPMITPATPVLLLEDLGKLKCIKSDSSDNNGGSVTSTYDTRAIDTLDTLASSQENQSQQQLLGEHEVVKLENGEILRTCMQFVEGSLKIGNISTNDSNHEKAGASATHTGFTIESNQEGDREITITTAGFTAEGNQMKVTEGVDKPTEIQYTPETSTLMRESSEETPLLQRVESIGTFSNSSEQHSKVSTDKPMTGISAMHCKAEAEEESDKSPLLSIREQSGEHFRDPNHPARKIKPFENFLKQDRTGMMSPSKKEQSFLKNNNGLVSSPIRKEKQKTRSSLFTNCMCCVTPTN